MCPWIPLNQLREVFLLVPIVICAKPRFNMQIEPPPPLRNAAEIDAAFREHEIIPDLLSKAPKYTLEVAFHREYYVDFGNYIVPAAWEQKPTKIHFAEAKKGSMYVLIMTGLDFPTRGRPRGREWWYWVFGDLVVGPGLGRKGKTVMAYIGPSEMKIYSGQTKSKEDSMRQITMKLPYHELFIKGTPVLVTFPIFLYLSIKIITADPLKKTPQEIESALKKFKIIPDVLDVAPKKAIKIYYETEVFPDFGNELNAEDCATEPYMMEWGAEEEKYYLFVMVDPDYASQNDSSQQGQYEHSVVGNIQFENLQRGTYMSNYHGPNPQPNTGYHRYVFLIYEQPYELEFAEKRLTWPKYGDERRFNFSAKRYAAKYYLNPPIACNFFVSKWQPPRIKNTTTLKPRPTPAYPWWYLAH